MGRNKSLILAKAPPEAGAQHAVKTTQKGITHPNTHDARDVEELEERVAGYIIAKDITTRELKACTLPDASISAVWVRLVDEMQLDHDYIAVHAPDGNRQSRILVCTNAVTALTGLDYTVLQIKKIAERVFSRNVVAAGTSHPYRSSGQQAYPLLDFRCPIDVNTSLTKANIGRLMRGYEQKFHAAYIVRAYFSHVPEENYANSHLPDDKVIAKGIYQAVSLRGIGHISEHLQGIHVQSDSMIVDC